ncbi:hypothetical protein FACS1894139_05870 [Planctomycetales bacterium]|nr:hypothetical protein FACS1894107_05310 [Planctomycetales bacterium]GHS97606.1 hypothetical protein FACS1894108_04280 [Planctomycetales bacterium]GHT04169.1 hypothetical protein FACS1894139_05870 [Planctomycetales bacterium]
MRISRRFILLIALFSAPLFAAEELVEEFVSVNYNLAGFHPTKEETAAAEKLAREKALAAALDGEANMAMKNLVEKYDLTEAIIADGVRCVPGFTVTASRVVENQLQVKAAVKINLREIGTLVRKRGGVATANANKEGLFVLYLAREVYCVVDYNPRISVRDTENVSDGDTQKTSGGSTTRKKNKEINLRASTDTLRADAGSVFSNRGFELYQAADLDLSEYLLKKIYDKWVKDNELPHGEIGKLREELRVNQPLRYFVLCWLAVGRVDFDKDVGQERCVVKAGAEVVDFHAAGKRGRTIFNTEAVLSRGFGENQTVAAENAMKSAAKETALRVAAGILQNVTGK